MAASGGARWFLEVIVAMDDQGGQVDPAGIMGRGRCWPASTRREGRLPSRRNRRMMSPRKRNTGSQAVRTGRWMARRDEPFAVFLFGILKNALC